MENNLGTQTDYDTKQKVNPITSHPKSVGPCMSQTFDFQNGK